MFTSLHLFFPFLPLLARWKTTDFSEGFSGLNICCLMLLGEHTHTHRRIHWETMSSRRDPGKKSAGFHPLHAWISAVFLCMPLWLRCVFPTLSFISDCEAVTCWWSSTRRIKEKMGFTFCHFLDISRCVQLGRLWHSDPEVMQHWADPLLDSLIQPSELKPRL